MWTVETRARHERETGRYPSDLTDAEWALIEPHLPPPRKSRRYKVPEQREIVNAILYVLTTGCQWRQLPKEFPSKSAVHNYLLDWHHDGTLTRIHRALYEQARRRAGRQPGATLAIVDSQSVKSAEKGGAASIPRAMTRARKSRARSATRRSIRLAS